MKRLLFFLIMICCLSSIQAQVIKDTLSWCPPGAKWVYQSFSPMSRLYYVFSYESDTIVDQVLTKKLSVNKVEYIGVGDDNKRYEERAGEEYLYESNDSIYWFDKVNNNFSFVYKNRTNTGEYFIAKNSRATCIQDSSFPKFDTLFITNVDVITIGNRQFNSYATSQDKNYYFGSIIQGIGSVQMPFPQINRIKCLFSSAEYGEFYEKLPCYYDSLRGYLEFQAGDLECMTSLKTGIKDLESDNDLRTGNYALYPNPASTFFTVKSDKRQIKKVAIYNSIGSFVSEFNVESTNPLIDVQHLQFGLYFLKVTDFNDSDTILKLFKN
jgi:hypothetical protein